MKAKELRQLANDQLTSKLSELTNSLFKTRVQFYAGEEVNSSSMKTIKRDIAKILTIMNEKKRMEKV